MISNLCSEITITFLPTQHLKSLFCLIQVVLPGFLLISICMESFSFPYFQFVCVFRSEVNLLQVAHVWVSFQYPFRHSFSLIGAFRPCIYKVIIDSYELPFYSLFWVVFVVLFCFFLCHLFSCDLMIVSGTFGFLSEFWVYIYYRLLICGYMRLLYSHLYICVNV